MVSKSTVDQICDTFISTLGYDDAVRLAVRLTRVVGNHSYQASAHAVVQRLRMIDQYRFKEVARELK